MTIMETKGPAIANCRPILFVSELTLVARLFLFAHADRSVPQDDQEG